MAYFETLFQALEDAAARYVVVGGVAVVLHGHARLTVDVDLSIDLEPDAARKVLEVLGRLGFVPRVPVDLVDFADPVKRGVWAREKNMQVFSLWDQDKPLRMVDLFVENPIDFAELWDRSQLVELATTRVRVASIPDLIRLKELAGRAQDLSDIEELRRLDRARKDSS